MRLLDPDLLRSFVAVCDTGSFTAAARLVHRTQAAVSMQIKRLEELAGCPLLERSPHRIELTTKGELLLMHARRILRANSEAVAAMEQAAIEGHVVLGIPPDYAGRALPAILARFAARYPRVTVEVVCHQSKDLIPMIESGAVDLGFVTEGEGKGHGVTVHREPCLWMTSTRADPHLLSPIPLALDYDGCTLRRWAVESLTRMGRDYRIAFTTSSIAAMQAAVRAGVAVTVIAQSSLAPGMRALTEDEGFPKLPELELRLQRSRVRQLPIFNELEKFLIAELPAQFAVAA